MIIEPKQDNIVWDWRNTRFATLVAAEVMMILQKNAMCRIRALVQLDQEKSLLHSQNAQKVHSPMHAYRCPSYKTCSYPVRMGTSVLYSTFDCRSKPVRFWPIIAGKVHGPSIVDHVFS